MGENDLACLVHLDISMSSLSTTIIIVEKDTFMVFLNAPHLFFYSFSLFLFFKVHEGFTQ